MNWPIDFTDRIILGDCLDVMAGMPDNAVDIVVTSPPYNQLGSKRRRAHGWLSHPGMFKGRTIQQYSGYEDDMPEEDYQAWLRDVVTECLRVSKGLVWVNHKVRYRQNKGIHPLDFLTFPLYTEIIWARNGSMALNCKRFAPSHEGIYGFGERSYWDDSYNRLLSVWNISATANELHPCSFPEEIPLRLIGASCPPSGIALDPFVGSGTSCVAAKRLGRHWIGIEANADYVKLAEKRVREAVYEPLLPIFE